MMGYLEETPLVSSEQEADALLEKISNPTEKSEEPFQATKEVNQEMSQKEAKEPVTDEVKHKIVWNKKEIELPISKLTSYAQQGYDYQEKMRMLNSEKAAYLAEKTKFDSSNKELQQRLQEYKEIEEYTKKDPKWWDHVRKSYQKLTQEPGAESKDPVLTKLSESVEKLMSWMGTSQEREKQSLMIQEDTQLDQEIKEFKDQNPQFDWNTLDEKGHDLEKRIGLHALNSGIKSYRAAARDYLFDEMLKRNEVKAKEELGKNIQKSTKLGLGSVRTESKAKISRPTSVRNKSYDDLVTEGLKEMGL